MSKSGKIIIYTYIGLYIYIYIYIYIATYINVLTLKLCKNVVTNFDYFATFTVILQILNHISIKEHQNPSQPVGSTLHIVN